MKHQKISNLFVYLMLFVVIFLFSASNVNAAAAVNLGTSGDFVILAKSGISTTGVTAITGDIGVSPIDRTALTGFSEIMDSTNKFSTSAYVAAPGKLYAADYADSTPAKMTAAVSDMETAYTDAAGRTLPDATELGAGDISGMTINPGLYKWGTGVHIDNRGVTLSGGINDVWIFQIAQDLTVDNAAIVTLSGGAQARNIFWQVAGGTGVSLGTTSEFKGNILATKGIVIKTGAKVVGRVFAQTAVTLDANTITAPGAAPVLTTITLLPTSKNITVGFTEQLNATGFDQFNNSITASINYTTSNSSIATVNESGLVSAIAVGTATISATSGTVSNTSTITVKAAPLLSTIIQTPSTALLTVGATQQLTATGFDQYNNLFAATINYISDNNSVATISSSGLITAVASGSAVITATSGSVTATNPSTITVETAAPTLSPIGSRSVTQGTQFNLTITANSPDELSLTFPVIAKPATATFTDNNDGTATFSWMPTLTDVGTTTNLNFTVTDGIKSDSEVVAITVNAFQAPSTTPSSPPKNKVIDLGTAGDFVILAKSGISTTGVTSITGNIGVGPIDRTALTGFSETMDSTNLFSTSSLVTGKLYAADYADSTPAKMTAAVSDMETAYTSAAGRTLPDATELGAGDISGMTIAPGLYKWSTGVLIDNRGVTLSGGVNDVWIFQIAQDLTVDNAAIVTLSGGAQAKNIFWQVAGGTGVSLGTTSEFKGNILAIKGIVLKTGATLDGRALAQTAVTLDANTVTVVAASVVEASPEWKNADYSVTLSASGFNNTPIAYINYTLNNVPGQIMGNTGNVLISTNGNNTLTYYAVDTAGNIETSNTMYALLDKITPNITSFTLSTTNLFIGDTILGTCIATDSFDSAPTTSITGDTSTAGAKTAICTATDAAGNTFQSSSLDYTVSERQSSGSGGGSGGGGSGSKKVILIPTQKNASAIGSADGGKITSSSLPKLDLSSLGQNNGVAAASSDNNEITADTGNSITGQAIGPSGETPLWWQRFVAWLSRIFGGN